MRVQLQDQHLRLRVQEAEFAQLLEGVAVENRTVLPDGRAFIQRLRLMPTDGATWRRVESGMWEITLPLAEARAYGERLPTREGLHFDLAIEGGNVLSVQFDVDVRDSVRKRPLPRFHKDTP